MPSNTNKNDPNENKLADISFNFNYRLKMELLDKFTFQIPF